MMFTDSPPHSLSSPIRLYFRVEDARAANGPRGSVYPVAVHYDALLHRLLPLEPVQGRPAWTAPAHHMSDCSVATIQPIPRPLYLLR